MVRIFFSNATYPKFRLNPWDFHDFRDRNRSFDGMAAYARHDLQFSGNGDPELVPAIRATAGYSPSLASCQPVAASSPGTTKRKPTPKWSS
jgi:hypothetical protein